MTISTPKKEASKPEYFSHEEFINRSKKLAEIRQLGIDPYPHKFTPQNTTQELLNTYPQDSVGHSEEALAGNTPLVSVAGRLILFRSMGKNAFAQIQDKQGKIQLMFNRDTTHVVGYNLPTSQESTEALSHFKFIEKKIDLGDIIGVKGHLFYTNKGELTVLVNEVTLLCKTLLPLADKHGGLSDKELRYRKRWLDLISNFEVQELFRQRSIIVRMVRDYLHQKGFIEVETPVLQSIYGGAEAKPFTTHLNALKQDMFLRISPEISLKKLIIGGMDRVFEIGKVFRNEGIDRNHNPEFTILEAYAAYWDYHDMMELLENLVEKIAIAIHGTTAIQINMGEGNEAITLDVKAPWIRLTMKDAILKYAKIDVDALNDNELIKKVEDSGHCDPKKLKTMNRGLLIAALFEIFAEPHLIQPHHIIDHPIETTPLCKLHRRPKDREQKLVERFESFVLGQEISNAYSELNDPELQRELLEIQAGRRDAGDEEASPLDEEFLEAICQGMPPTGGLGIGIDRLVMILTNSHSIRDVLYFPWMKPL